MPHVINGIGLFTGQDTALTLETAASGGIVFEADDASGHAAIHASIDALSSEPAHPAFAKLPPRSTNLAAAAARVLTTEHVLGALFGLGRDHARLTLDGPEIPIDDGSALVFTDALGASNIEHTYAPLPERIEVSDDSGGVIIAEPLAPGSPTEFRYELDYAGLHPLLGPQHAEWTASDTDGFARDIAPARTFSLLNEVEQMQQLGLFTRFTPADLLVLAPDGPVDNALRFDNEPARHKLLDLIGDLALIGTRVSCRFTAIKSGHALNHAMARAVKQALSDAPGRGARSGR